jgi:hypothetical protein
MQPLSTTWTQEQIGVQPQSEAIVVTLKQRRRFPVARHLNLLVSSSSLLLLSTGLCVHVAKMMVLLRKTRRGKAEQVAPQNESSSLLPLSHTSDEKKM